MLRNNGIHNFRSPLIAQGPQPSLILDFAGTGTLDSRVTFTRSSTATYTNSSGVLTLAAINAPRFDYNPTTLQALGLFIEEAKTNILLNSLLDGTNLSTQVVTTTAVPYTLSFYGTGTIVLSGTTISTQTGTGVYPSRKTFTFTPTAGALTLTVTGTVQYAQLETGSFATSFIPTAGSQVTRAKDVAQMTGTNFSSWFNSSEGTIFTEFTYAIAQASSRFDRAYEFTDATNNPFMALFSEASAVFSFAIFNGTSYVCRINNSISLVNSNKVASSFKINNFASSSNGTAATVISTGNVLSGLIKLNIGSTASGNASQLDGRIKKFTFYPSALTAAQLQALTTG